MKENTQNSKSLKAEIKENESYYRLLFELAADAILLGDQQGNITEANQMAADLTGYARNDLPGMNIKNLFSETVLGETPLDYTALETGKTILNERLLTRRNGTTVTILMNSKIMPDGTCYTCMRDISALVAAEKQIRLFKFSIDQASENIFWLGSSGEFLYVNDRACRSLGYSREELMHLHVWDIDPDFSQERFKKQWKTMRKSRLQTFETIHRRKDGTLMPVEISSNHVIFGSYEHHVSYARDITERKRYEERLEYQATHDALTGLANRTLLADRIAQSINHAARSRKKVAVLLLDLDFFKQANDSLGHSQGDHLLQLLADRLTHCVRAGDTVARFGGDEFVIVLTEIAETRNVKIKARQILTELSLPITIGEQEMRITASIGAGIYPDDGLSQEELIRQADKAMYQVKKRGGNAIKLISEV